MASPRPPYTYPTPLSITVTPDPATVSEDGTVQFTLTAHLDDGTDADYTHNASVRWTSMDEAVATVNTGVTTGGKCFGVFPGTCAISVTWIGLPGGDVEGVPTDPWPPDSPPYGSTAVADLTVTAAPPLVDPDGRFLLAFDQPTLEPNPEWTRLDDAYPNLITSYSIDRGRQYELDRFDTGRAQVQVADPDGVLNPLNPDGPFYGEPGPYGPLIKPLMQAAIGRQNPVTGDWSLRFRGFVTDLEYVFDPSQQLNYLTISLADLFELLASAEMHPGTFGTTPPDDSAGQIFFPTGQRVEQRIAAATNAFGLSRRFQVLFPGNVLVQHAVYSPGESPLTVAQEAADADYPGANLFCDRHGRLCFHDRSARFYPATVAASVGVDKWDYHEWKVGDGAAVEASISDTAQLREFAFDRGLSRLINSASATPAGIDDADVQGQLVAEPESISYFGIRSWSADGLLTKSAIVGGATALEETRNFAYAMVVNYKWLRDRITSIGFRPLHPDDPRAPALYDFLGSVDIGDIVDVTIASPGGGGYTSYQHFVEGIHEQVRPGAPDWDDVTLSLDLSPVGDYETSPWPPPE